ncbi:shikimate kinase [Agilicoccus flavus]|uniref:shikimate kinase n=1 Tax=Agilicoccus flavus TaxID=2775968 RepID=UPI001CF61F34|nr:shikimate kinase [Agilicoccus flavus]
MVNPGTAPSLVLVGPPGAGKSTVGALLAVDLGLPRLDTDDLVVERAGASIAEVFVDEGEEAFRAHERVAVVAALARGPAVVALGGGAVLDERTRADLAGHRVVFLDVALRDAARRAGFDQGRPLLALNPRGRWTILMNERRPVYEALASWRIDTGGRTAREVADEVLDLVRADRGNR